MLAVSLPAGKYKIGWNVTFQPIFLLFIPGIDNRSQKPLDLDPSIWVE